MECEIKWASGIITTNKAGGGDEIPVELFQILKDDAALNMPENLENSAVAIGLEMVSFHSNPKKGNDKECSNYHTIALISHTRKVMLKIFQARLQQYMNCELPDVQAEFKKKNKDRGTRDQIVNIRRIIKKVRVSERTSTSALLITPKPVWIRTN